MSKVIIICFLLAATASAQTSQQDIANLSRGDYWKQLRETKATELHPEQPGKFERVLFEIKERRIVERFQAGILGFHPLLGGLETGSGFGFGTQFRPRLSEDGQIEMTVQAQGTLSGYRRYEFALSTPRLANDHLFLGFNARRGVSPQQDFFGIGQDSRESNRTNYRYDVTDLQTTAGIRMMRWLETGAVAGTLNVDTGSGTDKRFPSVEQVFNNDAVPGLDLQPRYTYGGVFVRADNRDEPGNPRSGRKVELNWRAYRNRESEKASFERIEAEVQQYVPFFNKRRVIALRGRTVFSQTDGDNVVPFFQQPTLGGSEDLRGFREFRFRDRNMMVMNAEYRWEAFSGLDVALFGDTGKVFHSSKQFNLRDLETSYGFGFRFNTAKSVFWRVDTAFSKEGPRWFLKFGHVF
jgi:outer membrane protein assembly factor BamA